MRQNGIQVVRTRKFKAEEGQKMIRGIIFPTTHRQRPHLQHRAESLAARLHVQRQPPWPAHYLARSIPQDCVVASLEMFPEQFVLGVGHEAEQHGHER
jgi:hypothetical protein